MKKNLTYLLNVGIEFTNCNLLVPFPSKLPNVSAMIQILSGVNWGLTKSMGADAPHSLWHIVPPINGYKCEANRTVSPL